MCISLVLMAMAPVPLVFGLRYFNVLQDDGGAGGDRSAVSYTKGRIIKESMQLEEGDDASLLRGKTPGDTPSTPPPAGNSIYRKQSGGGGGGGTEADTAPNGRYGIGYLMADVPDMPESDL